ncbi:MAG: carbamoyltransferase HypF, partial [Methanomassiliicoccales archaeon]|nr:carbamoyltransferase HypF [Methanomassiliicoccales archaeon]
TVRGVVQGVGFRPTVHRLARSMDLHGYVQNNGSNVVIEIDGDAEEFVSRLKAALPPLARLDDVVISSGLPDTRLKDMGFIIVPSEEGVRGVGIPNDTAVCDLCLKEMFTPGDRRYLYPFTNCTDCGARFTVIEDLPYDRDKTSMRPFPLCPDCEREYGDVDDRRFHHQTITCPTCGPRYYLLDAKGSRDDDEPIAKFALGLQEGKIGVAKSWGGMHLCCSLDRLEHMRQWYGRKEKPFAIMVRDLDALKNYGVPSPHDLKLLTSGHRPIVLVEKLENEITELVAPGLGNIGVFLPYTSMQHLLFHHLNADALVMTSANVPGEPMVLRERDALTLGADMYLMHDRDIVNRCDDSVVRSFGQKTYYLRKSRGHIPSYIDLPMKGTAVGVGAQEGLAGALAHDGRLYATQYIGDASSLGVLEFLEESLKYLRRLLGVAKLDAIGMDMHPGHSTRRLAKAWAEESAIEAVEVQHHHAHAAALLVEAKLPEMVAITIDGTGYGDDGVAWGGEVLLSNLKEYRRLGHLKEVPLLGGEKAVYDVRRLAFALAEMTGGGVDYFPEGETEIYRKMMAKAGTSTSFGRVLDAISCYLGICQYRSYDGEPAMKLERWLDRSERLDLVQTVRQGAVIDTPEMFRQLMDSKGSRADRAGSMTYAMVRGLVDIAAEAAEDEGLEHIGLSGGVSYNRPISSWTKELVEERGLTFVCHDLTPNGDGCISTGQCAVALSRIGR